MLRHFDRDGDGLIENDGEPDQTYDTWPVSGPSAYTGGLWLASLQRPRPWPICWARRSWPGSTASTLARGQAAYQQKLWNGRYFNYDSSRNRHNDSIMADQLAGQWYARACGLPPIVEPEQVRSALRVSSSTTCSASRRQLGAVNGMRPDGKVDTTSMQSQEVWTGVTYAAGRGHAARGLGRPGVQYRRGRCPHHLRAQRLLVPNPRSVGPQGNYRSIAYMRPLAIWAMQWAWERRRLT